MPENGVYKPNNCKGGPINIDDECGVKMYKNHFNSVRKTIGYLNQISERVYGPELKKRVYVYSKKDKKWYKSDPEDGVYRKFTPDVNNEHKSLTNTYKIVTDKDIEDIIDNEIRPGISPYHLNGDVIEPYNSGHMALMPIFFMNEDRVQKMYKDILQTLNPKYHRFINLKVKPSAKESVFYRGDLLFDRDSFVEYIKTRPFVSGLEEEHVPKDIANIIGDFFGINSRSNSPKRKTKRRTSPKKKTNKRISSKKKTNKRISPKKKTNKRISPKKKMRNPSPRRKTNRNLSPKRRKRNS